MCVCVEREREGVVCRSEWVWWLYGGIYMYSMGWILGMDRARVDWIRLDSIRACIRRRAREDAWTPWDRR